MKNITITVEEEVARWARIWAAKHNSSLSRLVGELLKHRMLAEDGYHVAMSDYLSRRPSALRKKGRGYPKREELHDRKDLR